MKTKHFYFIFLVAMFSACDTNNPTLSTESPYPGYVNMGLPSGTLWKEHNEENMCELADALELYGDSLATVSQWKELYKYCTWTWKDNGYEVKGKNGNVIFLPAEGTYSKYYRKWEDVGERGEYWTSTPFNNSYNYYADFWSGGLNTEMFGAYKCHSIRCVKLNK